MSDLGKKAFNAVALLLAISVGLHIAANLLEPIIPTIMAIVILGVIGRLVFFRRR